TPLSSGNKAIPLADYTNGVVNYFYITYLQSVELNNLNSYLFASASAQPKSVVESELGCINYVYKRNGYIIFVSATAPVNGLLPGGNFPTFTADAVLNSQLVGNEAFYLGKVTAKGIGVGFANTDITLWDP